MRLKVFNNFTRRAWLEADTIETLKASIMDRFSLTADHLSQQRLLVRDNRDLYVDRGPITGCVDLLQLAEGTTLGGDLCKDGDSLRLGWKGPCSILLESGYTKDHKFKVDDSFTLRKLKDEIERLMGVRVAEDNLPEVLFNGDDDKPLLFFGYYLFSEEIYDVPFEIYCNKENISVVHGPVSRVVLYPTPQYNDCGDSADEMENLQVMTWDKDGNERLIPCKEFFIMEEPSKYTKNNNKRRKLQLKENTENQKKRKKNNSSKLKENTENQKKKKQKKKMNNNNNKLKENTENQKKKQKKNNNNNKGMEGDKDEASLYIASNESQPFN